MRIRANRAPSLSNHLKLMKFWGNKTNQRILCVFLFFLSYPIITIFFSVTFYIFIILFYRTIKKQVPTIKFRNYGSWVILLFGLSALISTVLSPPEQRESDNNYAVILVQYLYWVFLAIFIINNAKYFNLYRLSKYVFVGLCFLSLNFFLIKDALNFGILTSDMNRNTYAYIILCFFPLSTWYINSRYNQKGTILYMALITVLMLLTDGRSAGVLIILECTLLLQVYFPLLQKIFKKVSILVLLLIAIVSSSLEMNDIRKSLGSTFENISPRMAEFIQGTGVAGNLEMDKSWLTRELMIKKAFEISQLYPYFGIGPFKFSRYNANLEDAYSHEFRYLYIKHYGVSYYNRKSSHNSYFMVLAEQGWVGLLLFLLITFPLAAFILFKLIFLKINKNDIPLISIFTISLHFYAISAMPSAITWVVIGLAYARFHGTLNYISLKKVAIRASNIKANAI